MASIYDMADTWNDAGTTFTAIKMSVTNTASNGASRLMDLLVNGTSMFRVLAQYGQIEIPSTNGNLTIGNGESQFSTYGLYMRSRIELTWSSGSAHGSGRDTTIVRDAAGMVALRRSGASPHGVLPYNTYTSATDYERGFARWASDVFEIGTEAGAGGGTIRPMALTSADIRMANIPTSDPAVAGQLYSMAGVLMVSAG